MEFWGVYPFATQIAVGEQSRNSQRYEHQHCKEDAETVDGQSGRYGRRRAFVFYIVPQSEGHDACDNRCADSCCGCEAGRGSLGS